MTVALIYSLVGLSYVLAILITAALWLAWRELVRIRRGLSRGRVNRVNKAMPRPGEAIDLIWSDSDPGRYFRETAAETRRSGGGAQ